MSTHDQDGIEFVLVHCPDDLLLRLWRQTRPHSSRHPHALLNAVQISIIVRHVGHRRSLHPFSTRVQMKVCSGEP